MVYKIIEKYRRGLKDLESDMFRQYHKVRSLSKMADAELKANIKKTYGAKK